MPELTNEPQTMTELTSGFPTPGIQAPQPAEQTGTTMPGGQPTPDGTLPEDDDAIDYQTPPPRRVFVVDVQYHFVGKGDPMPYALDDVGDEP